MSNVADLYRAPRRSTDAGRGLDHELRIAQPPSGVRVVVRREFLAQPRKAENHRDPTHDIYKNLNPNTFN